MPFQHSCQKFRPSIFDILRNKSEKTRKKILWGSVIFIAVILLFCFALNFKHIFSNMKSFSGNVASPDVLDQELQGAGETLEEINIQNFKEVQELKEKLKKLEESEK